MFPNLVVKDYKSHAITNEVITFWLNSTSVNLNYFVMILIPKPPSSNTPFIDFSQSILG